MAIGWYGVPGGPEGSMTHVVHDGRPVCGTRFHRLAEFQWCCHDDWTYVPECERCKRFLKNVKPQGLKVSLRMV